ncbi:MAG TPA: sugar phosphate isomerase/epimerase [Puia sp.]|nr:sugar phosphate isomerase/epimerase [Puia sp.]
MTKRNLNRRDFLQVSGMGLLGTSIFKPVINAFDHEKWKPAKLSVQLYTVRNQISADIQGTLRKVREIGFQSVETAFWPEGVSIQNAAKYIKDAGLSVSSAHIEIPVGDKKQTMLDTAAAFDCKKMIWHGWPEDKRYSSLQGTMELISIYNEAGKFAKANGLQFGLHNHWWEYRNKIDGRFVYEYLLEYLDPNIFFEVDTYWVKVAGQDPSAIVKKLGSRAPLLHIKDGPAKWNDLLPQDNPDPMTAVGKGTQNFPEIVKAANGNTEWMVVEMDKTSTDVFEALKESYDYLIDNKLARVK